MTRLIPARIVAVAVLLFVALTAMILREEQLRQSGREVLLSLETVDPRDLLSGHYAALSLEEPLDLGQPCPLHHWDPPHPQHFPWSDQPPPDGWIALSRKGDHYVPTGFAKTKADAAKFGEILVRGGFYCVEIYPIAQDGPSRTVPQATVLVIGVSRFHADQRQAEHIAASMPVFMPGRAPPAPAYAIVSIGADGRARLKGLQVAGQRLTLSWF